MNENASKRKGIAELGPAWISAIAALLATTIAAASFVAGRNTARPDSATEPTGGQQTSSEKLANPSRSGGQPSQSTPLRDGTQLAAYTVDLTNGYGLSFADPGSRPAESESGVAQDITNIGGVYNAEANGTFATVDSTSPSYLQCSKSTRFRTWIQPDSPGESFCYIGHGLVVRIRVTKIVISEYQTLDITIWSGQLR